MFERIERGWRLGLTALSILRHDKKLLIFPLLSGLACLLVTASFAIPIFLNENVRFLIKEGDVSSAAHSVISYVILFAFYFVNYLVIIFFNAALVACAMKRFNGEEPTLADGFNIAMARLPKIVAWSLVSATVGTI